MEPCSPAPARSKQLGQEGKDRRGVAAGGGRFAHRQPDFPLGHGEAGHRIHHQQHVLPLVAEILGDGHGDKGAL